MIALDERQAHAVLDLASREAKGRKIEALLGLPVGAPIKLLEVGTGAGGIAHYFATRSVGPCDVDAVDVRDQRQVKDGYRFTLIDSTELPFGNQSFDVVVSNHVIEHVGDRSAQLNHLKEMRRVLTLEGMIYLAVPNRWMLVEPHFRLPFLSWLPRSLRTMYVQASGRGSVYDCEPLTLTKLNSLIMDAGLIGENASVRAFRAVMDIEKPRSLPLVIAAKLPDWILSL